MIPLFVLFVGAVVIGLAPILTKGGMGDGGVGPAAAAFWRTALAAPVFWAACRLAGDGRAAAPGSGGTLRLAPGLFFAADLVSWHASFRYTTTANATLLANLAAAIVPLAGWLWLGERLGGRFAAGAALALLGTGLLVGAGIGSEGRLVGDGLATLTAVFYAGYLLSVKRLRARFSMPAIMLWSSLTAAAVLAPVAVLLGERLVPGTASAWKSLAALALFCQILGQGAIVYALAHLPVGFSAVALVVQPVVVAVIGWALLGEALGLLQVAGGALVVVGIVLARLGSAPAQETGN